MATAKRPHYSNITARISSTLSAHDALRKGIATHAERHTAALDAARRESNNQAKIAAGLERHAS